MLSRSVALKEYAEKRDSAYEWRIGKKERFLGSEVLDLSLQSQRWRGTVWKHRLKLLTPEVSDDDYLLLFVTGSGDGVKELMVCKSVSDLLNLPCVILHDIPNQPLFNGLYEDEIIAFTFLKFAETGDEEWPLLLPMVKGVKKAMDALEELLERVSRRPKGFIVTGGSKRGWTTWLTSAVDKRVKGIAPFVYDNLNLVAQMRHQVECYGSYSEQISDYTKLKLQEKLKTEIGQRLAQIVDPYNYRDEITVPKMIINGTNDRYWTVDSLNLYYDELVGEKYIVYVPNSGHGLEDKRRVINSISAFASSIITNSRLPEVKGGLKEGKEVTMRISVAGSPLYVDFWRATSSTMDFRDSKWESFPGVKEADDYIFRLNKPERYTASFAEATFLRGEQCFSLSTKMTALRPAGSL